MVVCEHTSPVKGKFIEKVGFYNPLSKECVYNEERIKYWVSVGAKTSDTLQSLLDKKGKITQKKRTRIGQRKKDKLEAMEAEKEAEKAAEKEAKNAPKEEKVEEVKEEKVETEEKKVTKPEVKEDEKETK